MPRAGGEMLVGDVLRDVADVLPAIFGLTRRGEDEDPAAHGAGTW